MPSKPSSRLSAAEIEAFEAARNIGDELLQSISDMKAGKVKVLSPAVEARSKPRLSQSQFAELFARCRVGSRDENSGAARTLLAIARTNPQTLLAVSGK